LAEVARKFKDEPIVDVPVGGVDHVLVSEVLKGTNVPTYNLPDKAACALKALYLYGKIREKVTRE
jgi:acyl-CoA synthetase (NDP forming)